MKPYHKKSWFDFAQPMTKTHVGWTSRVFFPTFPESFQPKKINNNPPYKVGSKSPEILVK